jgi:hypothetical protein
VRDFGDECDRDCCKTEEYHELTPELDLGLAVVGIERFTDAAVSLRKDQDFRALEGLCFGPLDPHVWPVE